MHVRIWEQQGSWPLLAFSDLHYIYPNLMLNSFTDLMLNSFTDLPLGSNLFVKRENKISYGNYVELKQFSFVNLHREK